MKFGGKSLGSKEKMQNICKFIKKVYENDKKIIIVVSAMGKTTDELVSLAREFGGAGVPPRELSALLSTGETQSSALMAMMLQSLGLPAKSLQAFQLQTTTFGGYDCGRIAYINKTVLNSLMENATIAVVAGFQGINSSSETTTLGRGGSDTTASAIGAIFGHEVEIYSDFDGVFAGDPRELPYKKLEKIDYEQMIDLASGGAKVIDSRATEIAKKFGIDLISKASAKPESQGTIISSIENDIISVSTIDNLSQITIVVPNKERFENTLKIVFSCLKNINFYNFNIKIKNITFLISSQDKAIVVSKIAKKLNLLKKK